MDEALFHFFASLDRSLFVDSAYKAFAKLDRPLPIAMGQTISQPSLVLYMTEQLALKKTHKVLESGQEVGIRRHSLLNSPTKSLPLSCMLSSSPKPESGLLHLGITPSSTNWVTEA